MRTAVMGVGSLGTIVGALITKSGRQVDLIDVDEKNVAALNAKGAKITGFLELTVPVKAITPSMMDGTYDLVILLTKQTYNKDALTSLLPHLGENSTVCTLQNGIPEDSVASYVGAKRTVGGTVGFGATWEGPGVSALTSEVEALQKFAFSIGEIDGKITPRINQVKDVLSAVGGTTVVENLMGIRWTKLLMNATFSGMSAALGCTFGDVLANRDALEMVAHIADETIKAAHATGCRLVETHGADLELLELKAGESTESKMAMYHKVWGPHGKLKASMLQDLEKGRKTEIININGHVCQKGRETGVKTPYNDLVVTLVGEAESKRQVPDFNTNLKAVKAFLSKIS